MNIGLLNEKVTFQKNTVITDSIIRIGTGMDGKISIPVMQRLAARVWQAPRKRKRLESLLRIWE